MTEKRRVLLLVLIMAVACAAVTATTIVMLYRTAFEEQRDILAAIARTHARLIEEMAVSNAGQSLQDYPRGQKAPYWKKLFKRIGTLRGIGHTGEFALAKREGNNMVYLLDSRYKGFHKPAPIPMNSKLGEPMRRALLGYSGSMIGLDYRGAKVLAAL